jgi:hypothetical protein
VPDAGALISYWIKLAFGVARQSHWRPFALRKNCWCDSLRDWRSVWRASRTDDLPRWVKIVSGTLLGTGVRCGAPVALATFRVG